MASLDMTLEDIIKNRRNSERGRGQGRPRRGRGSGGSSYRGGRAYGAPSRGPLGLNARPSARTIAKTFRRTKSLPWQNGLLEDSLKAAGLSGLENGTKLFVSNLFTGVTSEDIRVLKLGHDLSFYSTLQCFSVFAEKGNWAQELFSEIGELMRYALHYDKYGRPSGSAEVVFARRSDAFQALKRYNNVELDGKPMKIEIDGANAEIPISARVNVVGGANGKKRTVVMGSGSDRFKGGFTAASHGSVQRARGGSNNGSRGGRGLSRGRGRGRGRGLSRGRGRGVAHGRKKNVEKSAEDLDKELDHYHAAAMES